MEQKKVYVELMRIFASLAVITIHVTAGAIQDYKEGSFDWIFAVVCNSLSRWCIPLFFMISGGVLLDRKQPITVKQILNRNVFRLVKVLIVWGIPYYFFDLWKNGQTVSIKKIVLLPFAIFSGQTGYHLWYLYVLVLIYLFVPLLKSWVYIVGRRMIEYAVCLFFVCTLVIGFYNSIILRIGMPEILQINFVMTDLQGYMGSFLVGYYLSHYEVPDIVKRWIYIISGVGVVIVPVGNILISTIKKEYMAPLSDYNGLFSVVIAAGIYIHMRNKEEELRGNSKRSRRIINLGKNTFGIYILHVFFTGLVFHKFSPDISAIPAVILLPVCVAIVFAVSAVLTAALKRLQKVSRLIGL